MKKIRIKGYSAKSYVGEMKARGCAWAKNTCFGAAGGCEKTEAFDVFIFFSIVRSVPLCCV